MKVRDVVRMLQIRELEYLQELEKLRSEYPSLRDDEILALMYLQLKDSTNGVDWIAPSIKGD